MIDNLRKEYPYYILILGMCVFTCLKWTLFRYGFCTMYDEGYFLLKIQEASDGIVTGKSLWNLLVVNWFPFLNLVDKVDSNIASWILLFITSIIVAITSSAIINKKFVVRYFAITYTFLFVAFETPICGILNGLNYVPISGFLLTLSLCSFLLFINMAHGKVAYLVCAGFFCGVSLFVILPGGILVFLLYLMYLIVACKEWRLSVRYIGWGGLGIVLSVLYIHFFVCNISDVFAAMVDTAGYITKTKLGYTPMQCLLSLGYLMRSILICAIIYMGCYYISKSLFSKYSRYVPYVYMLLLLAGAYYVPNYMLLSILCSSTFVIPWVVSRTSVIESWRKLDKEKFAIKALLLLFPIFASVGTNTGYEGRLCMYISAWLFLWFGNMKQPSYNEINRLTSMGNICVAILYIGMAIIPDYLHRNDEYHFTTGREEMANIALTSTQVDYFNRIQSQLYNYSFDQQKSYVFATGPSYGAIYALNCKLSSNFHQMANFPFFDKSNMKRPDFFFLVSWDEPIFEIIHEQNWGWPEEFDKFIIPAPNLNEDKCILYCRKSMKK